MTILESNIINQIITLVNLSKATRVILHVNENTSHPYRKLLVLIKLLIFRRFHYAFKISSSHALEILFFQHLQGCQHHERHGQPLLPTTDNEN
jgi:hypothetical protein